MKYLILFIALFMVSNVNAEKSYLDIYRTLSNSQIETYVNNCKLENFPINTSNDEKGDICLFAYLYTLEKMKKESNPKIKFQLLEEQMRYLVKAGNFYYLINRNNDLGKTINHIYNTKCHTFTNDRIEKFCNIIKRYKGLTPDLVVTSDYGRYAKQKGFQWSDPFSDKSLYCIMMGVAEFIGMAIPWVILFFVLRKYIFYKPKRTEKKNTDNTVSDTNVEQYTKEDEPKEERKHDM